MAKLYVAAKGVVQDSSRPQGPAGVPAISRAQQDLELITNHAKDRHLRANASIVLGSLYEQRRQPVQAIAYYRHATKLVPDDAGPHMALALALAAHGDFKEATAAQEQATKLDPDNLENWLALGEMRLKGGDQKGATQAYAGYEMRRRGLLEGLTGKKDGEFVVAPSERAECALALASASDNGTALALLYALDSDPDAQVRAAVVRTMGIQRLRGYQDALRQRRDTEADAEVRKAIDWALSEIERDPLDSKPGPAPQSP